MKLLLTDTSHLIGRALEHELEREPFNLLSPAPGSLDWCNPGAVAEYVRLQKPDLVLNCLGWHDRPDAEQCQLLVQGLDAVARACAARDVPLLHLSSYRVFGSDNKSIHSEKDAPAPLGPMGQAFWQAEQILAEQATRWLALRLSWVIAAQDDNPLTRLLTALTRAEPVQLNRRLRGAPTAVSDAARVAVAMVKQIACGADNWGVMHYCSGDACNELEFAEQVLHTLEQQEWLERPAQWEVVDLVSDTEPVSAVLSCRRARDNFGVQARSWRPSLLPLIKQWRHNHPDD